MIPAADKLQIDILQMGMAAQNVSGDGQQKAGADFTCSPEFSPGLNGQLAFLSVVNALMSVTAFLGNVLMLFSALHKESSLHPPSKLLLRCLAATDLCVGLTSEPLTVICWMSVTNGHRTICPYICFKNKVYSLRNADFDIPRYSTVRYGKHSIRYLGPYLWSRLSPSDRQQPSLDTFRRNIRKKDMASLIEGTCSNWALGVH